MKDKMIFWCMIMRDERDNIRKCLHNIAHICIGGVLCDTGSIDNTPDTARRTIDELGKDAVIVHHTWVNYSHNRNLAMAEVDKFIAKKLDVDRSSPITWDTFQRLEKLKVYIFITDVDNTIKWCNEAMRDVPVTIDSYTLRHAAYYVESRREDTQYQTTNLVRWDPLGIYKWIYYGSVHEILDYGNVHHSAPENVSYNREFRNDFGILPNIYIEYGQSGYRSKDKTRIYWEMANLVEDAEIFQSESSIMVGRNLFYSAQAMYECGFHEVAEQLYTTRFKMNDPCISERYISALRAAGCAYERKDMEEYLEFLYIAYEMGCRRMEAPFFLCEYFKVKGMYNVAWNLGKPYLEVKVDPRDLFIDMGVNYCNFFELMGVCAFHVGKHKEGRDLMLKALRYDKLPAKDKEHISLTLSKMIEQRKD